MKSLSRRLAAVAVVGAVVLGGISMAQSASADQLTGTLQLHGPKANVTTIGPVITSGHLDDQPAFYGLTSSVGCPAGYQGRSDTFAFQNGVKLGALSSSRNASVTNYGHTGLDGQPIAMDDTYANPGTSAYVNDTAFGAVGLVTGNWEIRVYCAASNVSINLTTDKYLVLPMVANVDANTWATADSVPAGPVTPTVSLTGAAQGDKTIKLTATVKNAGNVATDAAGSVKFFDSGNAVVNTGTIAAGVSSFTTGVMAPGTYTYTAQYIHTGTTYNDSAVSGVATVVISSNQGTTNITVTIAPNSGGGSLTLTGVANSVDLGTAVLTGGSLVATGTLPAVTVTDTRQLDAPAWSLTGITTDFASGAKVLDGKYLGWAPFTNDASTNAGTIGAAVAPAPGTSNGIKSAATLASGSVVNGKSTTKVGAQLNLAAPSNTPSGAYSATLTLTLV